MLPTAEAPHKPQDGGRWVVFCFVFCSPLSRADTVQVRPMRCALLLPCFTNEGREAQRGQGTAPVTQHMSAELALELSGPWAYPVTAAGEGRDVTEGTVSWTLREVVLDRHGIV